MDIATIGGLVLALGAIVAAVIMDGGHLSALWSTSAFILIIGGTIGVTLMSYSLKDFLALPGILMSGIFTPKNDPQKLVGQLVAMAEKARKEGLLALQDDVQKLDNPLLARGVTLIVDGTDPEVVKNTLETQVKLHEAHAMGRAGILDAAGGYAPTVGIIGTVMGLVHVLGNLSDAEKLGPAIAIAFLATFYGIATANLFWLPLGAKVKANIHTESLIGEMIIHGVVSLQTGEAPRAMKEKLEVFLMHKAKEEKAAKPGADEQE